MKVEFKLPNNIEVTDKVSGRIGLVRNRQKMINGCVQYWVQPKHKEDGSAVEGFWADFEDLKYPIEYVGYSEVVNFKFDTGDKIYDKFGKIGGIISNCVLCANNCVFYWFSDGTYHDGKLLEYNAYEPTIELVQPKALSVKEKKAGFTFSPKEKVVQ